MTDVTDLPCTQCRRLICDDYLTCDGYLRDLLNRLDQAPPERGSRQPIGLRIRQVTR